MADQGAVPAAQQPRVSVVCGDTHRASALDVDDPALTSEIKEIVAAAITRWLKNEEVYNLLEQFQVDDVTWAKEPADKPEGGKLFVFSRKACRGFRSDKHNWRRKQDGRTVRETHEKLKVGDKERLNCYYAHAEGSEGLQRRCYWILGSEKDDVVLVHYLCSATSRIGGGRGLAITAAGADGTEAVASRPQRAHRARNPRFTDYKVDSEDEGGLPDVSLAQGALPRPRSRGRIVPIQVVPPYIRSGEQPRTGGTPATRALDSQNDSFLDNPYLQTLPYHPTWHTLPSLKEQEAAAKEGRLNATAALPVHRNPAGNPNAGSPTKSHSTFKPGLLLRDPTGSGAFPLSGTLSIDPLLDFNFSMPAPHLLETALASQSSDTPSLIRGAMMPPPAVSLVHLNSLSGANVSAGIAQYMAPPPLVRMPTFQSRGSGGEDLQRGLSALVREAFPPEEPGENTAMREMSVEIANIDGTITVKERKREVLANTPDGAEGVGATDEALADSDAVSKGDKIAKAPPEQVAQGGLHHQESSAAAALADASTPPVMPKVETIRRVVAPGYRRQVGASSTPSLAEVAKLCTSDAKNDDEGMSERPSSHAPARRKNPTSAPEPPSSHDRVAAAAVITAERREEKLTEMRQARQAEAGTGQASEAAEPQLPAPPIHQDSADISLLIDAPNNHLFRITSHVVRDAALVQSVVAEMEGRQLEEATSLMKEMSIEKKNIVDVGGADGLMRNMSIDKRTDLEGGSAAAVKSPEGHVSRNALQNSALPTVHSNDGAFGSDQKVAPSSTGTVAETELGFAEGTLQKSP